MHELPRKMSLRTPAAKASPMTLVSMSRFWWMNSQGCSQLAFQNQSLSPGSSLPLLPTLPVVVIKIAVPQRHLQAAENHLEGRDEGLLLLQAFQRQGKEDANGNLYYFLEEDLLQ